MEPLSGMHLPPTRLRPLQPPGSDRHYHSRKVPAGCQACNAHGPGAPVSSVGRRLPPGAPLVAAPGAGMLATSAVCGAEAASAGLAGEPRTVESCHARPA